MQPLGTFSNVRRLLCVGAHSDDIEIGCGATVLRLLRELPNLKITWAVFCAAGKRGDEARAACETLTGRHDVNLRLLEFRDAHLPGDWMNVKAAVGALRDSEPDLIFSHRLDDRHQDHRLLAEFTGQTFRDHTILGYEIPKYDGDLGQPNVFVPCSECDLKRKCRACDVFKSQQSKQWFDDDTFRGLARIRGIECNSPTRFAEAFYCRKLSI